MVLVVGGAGYIGSHMVRRLRESGTPHIVFDNFELGHRAAVKDSPIFEGDLRDPRSIDSVFETHPEIDSVLHFGAYTLVGESVTQPEKYWRNNVVAVLNLLEAMRTRGIDRFVFSSTCATFGIPVRVPIDESHPQNPINPYGETKLAVERILSNYSAAYGLRSVSLRYFNACGAHPSGEIGEDHRPEVHLIPNAIFAAIGQTGPLNVFGSDYPTPDGTCVRDYIHVEDLVDAHTMALDHLADGGESRCYNLGNGRGFSVREVIEFVSQVVGQAVPFVDADRRPGDPAELVGFSERIRRDWGWSPKYQDLGEIIETAWNWHRRHPHGYID